MTNAEIENGSLGYLLKFNPFSFRIINTRIINELSWITILVVGFISPTNASNKTVTENSTNFSLKRMEK